MREKEPFQKGDRVKHRLNGKEGEVETTAGLARRRVIWDDDRITITHVGDLLEMVD
jgi:hypothetical protein